MRHPLVDPNTPVRIWRVDDTWCATAGVGRLWLHVEWPPRELPNPSHTEKAVLRVEWRRATRQRLRRAKSPLL